MANRTLVVAPRLANNFGRVCIQGSGLRPIQRAFGSGRYLWPWRRSSCLAPYDSFFDRHFAEMERMMDSMMLDRPRLVPWWFRDPVYVKAPDRDVQVKYDDKIFEVTLDVSQFSPEEIELKVIEDKLIVTGKHHETRDEHGTIAREFTRQFLIPKDVDQESIQSQLSTAGQLVIKGTVLKLEEPKGRTIKIEHQEEKPTTDEKKSA